MANASYIANRLCVPVNEVKLTLPEDRAGELDFGPDDLVILAAPTYAGRVPNKIEPDLRRILHFDGSLAVALVSFGNRSFGTAPEELADILTGCGAKVITIGDALGAANILKAVADAYAAANSI